VRILIAAVKKFFRVNGLLLASGLAFDIILCTIPFVFVVISILGYTLSTDQAIAGAEEALQQFFPRSHEFFADTLPQIAAKRQFYGLVGVGLFLFASSVAFGSVRTVLDTIFDVSRRRNFFIGKGIDLLMMLAVAAMFVLVVGLESTLAFLRGAGRQSSLLSGWLEPGWNLLGHLVGFGLTWSLFYLIFRFCPSQRLNRRALFVACMIGTVLLELSKWFFAWFLAHAQTYAVLYGTLSGLFFFFVWAYYASLAFIFSATIAAVVKKK
jgi:YihY family inner membrane protein